MGKLMKLNENTFFYGHQKIELVGPRVVITKFPGKLKGLVEVPDGAQLYRWYKALATGQVCTISGTDSNWIMDNAYLIGQVWQVEQFRVRVDGDDVTIRQTKYHTSRPYPSWIITKAKWERLRNNIRQFYTGAHYENA